MSSSRMTRWSWPEHRGNKLGLLIKVANMERLTEQFPDARVLYTWNAPENRYLLR